MKTAMFKRGAAMNKHQRMMEALAELAVTHPQPWELLERSATEGADLAGRTWLMVSSPAELWDDAFEYRLRRKYATFYGATLATPVWFPFTPSLANLCDFAKLPSGHGIKLRVHFFSEAERDQFREAREKAILDLDTAANTAFEFHRERFDGKVSPTKEDSAEESPEESPAAAPGYTPWYPAPQKCPTPLAAQAGLARYTDGTKVCDKLSDLWDFPRRKLSHISVKVPDQVPGCSPWVLCYDFDKMQHIRTKPDATKGKSGLYIATHSTALARKTDFYFDNWNKVAWYCIIDTAAPTQQDEDDEDDGEDPFDMDE